MIRIFGKRVALLNDDQVKVLEEAGHTIIDGLAAGAQAVEHAIIASPIGSKIADAIHAVKDKELSGTQKFEAVLADVVPLVVSFATDGGVALIASAEDTARGVIQTVYNATVGAVKAGADEAATSETPAAAAEPAAS